MKYGFSFIGGETAYKELHGRYEDTVSDLTELTRRLQQDTGLHFRSAYIPGSAQGNPNINESGGAIGLQFMPNKALEMYKMLGEVGYKFNPFDLTSAIVAAYVFLARQEVVGKDESGVELIRYGYLKGNDQSMSKSILKWNPLESEMKTVIAAAKAYADTYSSSVTSY